MRIGYTNKNTHIQIKTEQNGRKDEKPLYKLMNNAVYGKAMEKLKNKIDVKLVSNKKDYLKWTSKASHKLDKIFDNYLVTIHKSKVTLTLNKPVCFGWNMYFKIK